MPQISDTHVYLFRSRKALPKPLVGGEGKRGPLKMTKQTTAAAGCNSREVTLVR